MLYEQLPACVMTTDRPAIVSVPLRAVTSLLAATENVVVPLPEPLLPELIVIQLRLSVAVHAHPGGAVTVSVRVVAADSRFCDVGDTVKLQPAPPA